VTSAARQLIIGLVALPLSMTPFAAYASFTPEGRLVRDKAVVAIAPPKLPRLTSSQAKAAADAAPRYSDAVAALVYHGIGSADGDSDSDGGMAVSPKRFGEHLATLRAAGMKTVTAAEVAEARRSGKHLPDNAVMISFDDGRSDAVLFADPLLKQARMKATMFVITSSASEPGVYYASWDKLTGAASSGRWDLQSHTASMHHEQKVDGVSLPALTSLGSDESITEYRQRVRRDLADATAAIEEHTGRRPTAFAYPFGAYGAERTNDPRIRAVLAEEVARQYDIAFEQDGQDEMKLVQAADNPLELRRLEVGDWTGLELLARIRGAAARTFPEPEAPAPAPAPAAPAEPPAPEAAPSPEAPPAAFVPPAPAPSRATTRPRVTATAPRPSTSAPSGSVRSPAPAPAPAPAPSPTYTPPPAPKPTPPPPTTTTTQPCRKKGGAARIHCG